MERIVVVVSAALLILAGIAGPGACMAGGPMPGCGAPPCTYVTKMIPCVKTQMVPQVVPCKAVVPVKQIGYRCQKVLVRGMPVGMPCGMDPCTKCCPQPFCQVVTQKVPYVYYVPKCVSYYNVTYKPVCCTVWLPQTYKVEATPLCY